MQPAFTRLCHRLPAWGLAVAMAVALATALALSPAQATSIVVLVNDEPITEYDVAQRTRLIQATTGGQGGRQQAVDELIEEKLKLQAARRLSVSVSESELDSAFNRIATQVNLSPAQFRQALAQIGVNPETLRDRLRGDLAWRDVVRSQLQREIDIRERDIEAALVRRGEAATAVSIEYLLQQITFVIPANSSQDYIRRRQQEANTFRSQFRGCDSSRELARDYRDTVVRPEVRRSSNDLTPELRDMLINLSEGQISPATVSPQAVEMVAVCGRSEIEDREAARSEIQQSMISDQGERLARRLMIDLKQAAIIEHRR